jgi:hypothetical protein
LRRGPGKKTRSHVVLHDLDAVLVLERHAGYLVKGDDVPEPDQADLAAGHVVEEVRDRRLATGNQDAVRTDFLVDVALAGPPRAEFHEIVVVLDKWDHAGQQVPLYPVVEVRGFHAGGPKQDVDPLILCEFPSRREQFLAHY